MVLLLYKKGQKSKKFDIKKLFFYYINMIFRLFAFILLLLLCNVYSGEIEKEVNMKEKIHWLGHASFRIEGTKTIYIDPWKIKTGKKADLILITHDHYDHCSPDDVAKVSGKDTTIVTISSCAKQIKGNVKTIKAGETIEVGGVKITAIPSYNKEKQFHPREKGYVGYIVDIDGSKIYHAGDSDFIDEMKSLKVDIALMPVGGNYTMDAKEAAQAINTFKPSLAIPMHWGDIVGSKKDAETFCSLVKVPCSLLKQE